MPFLKQNIPPYGPAEKRGGASTANEIQTTFPQAKRVCYGTYENPGVKKVIETTKSQQKVDLTYIKSSKKAREKVAANSGDGPIPLRF